MKTIINNIKSFKLTSATKLLMAVAFVVYLPFMVQSLNGADNSTNGYIRKFHGYDWENSQGRFFIRFFDMWRDSWIPRVLIVALCIIFLCIMAQLVCDILAINKPDSANIFVPFLTGALIVFSPSIANLLTYYYCADSYCFAYLLVVLASYILIKNSTWGSRIAAVILMAISAGIYQAYIGMAIVLILINWFCKLTEDPGSSDNSESLKDININSLLSLICVGVSMLGYLILFKFLSFVHYLYPTSTRGMDNMLGSLLSTFPNGIVEAYKAFLNYFFTNDILNNDFFGRRILNVIIIIALLAIVIFTIISRKTYRNIPKLLLCIAIVVSLPLFLCLIVLIAPEASVYAETGMLMLPYMNILYILPIALLSNISNKSVKHIYNIIVTLALIIMVVFIQLFASMIEIENAQMTSVATMIAHDVDKISEGNHDIPLLITGRLRSGNYPFPDSELEEICKGMVSRYGLIYSTDEQISEGWVNYIKYYVGIDYKYPDEETRIQILDSSEFSDMSIYPTEDSVKIINDVIVVRLSNEDFR